MTGQGLFPSFPILCREHGRDSEWPQSRFSTYLVGRKRQMLCRGDHMRPNAENVRSQKPPVPSLVSAEVGEEAHLFDCAEPYFPLSHWNLETLGEGRSIQRRTRAPLVCASECDTSRLGDKIPRVRHILTQTNKYRTSCHITSSSTVFCPSLVRRVAAPDRHETPYEFEQSRAAHMVESPSPTLSIWVTTGVDVSLPRKTDCDATCSRRRSLACQIGMWRKLRPNFFTHAAANRSEVSIPQQTLRTKSNNDSETQQFG